MPRSTKLAPLLVLLAFAASTALQAQTAAAPAPPKSPAGSRAAGQGALAHGEVLEIYPKEKRVLVKHGPIQNIGMDAMAMEFSVPDAKLFASLKPGDKLRFAAGWKDGDYEITHAEVLKRTGSKRPGPHTR